MTTQEHGALLNADPPLQVSTKICQPKQQLYRLKFAKLATIARLVHTLQLQA